MRRYDVVAVGSGFATTFWILEYLRHAPAAARVLVLERGPAVDPAWRLENRSNSPIRPSDTYRAAGPVAKPWIFTIGLGGGANCWAGCAPRFLPSDFRMRSLYGVGRDWPIGYDDLEPFYTQAEAIMALSGSAEDAPWPMSRPYPQPPHRMSDPDLMMRRKHGRLWIPQPTARARVATETRAACCENSVCEVCPLDAKFMIRNDLPGLWADQRVEFRTDAKALEVEVGAGLARSVLYREGGEEKRVAADIVVLGANAIFNAHLLQASGLGGPQVGRGLHEQVAVWAGAYLSGVEGFQGSTIITANGYMFYDGPHRSERAACLIESHNTPLFRMEKGRWREVMVLKAVFEALPQEPNRVEFDPEDPEMPVVRFAGYGAYTERGIDALPGLLGEAFDGLPVEDFVVGDRFATQLHIIGTTPMGADAADSVVDHTLRVHGVANLFAPGSGCFPTSSPTNPTLTLCALSLRSARLATA